VTKLIVAFRNFANTPKLCRVRQSVVSFLKINISVMFTSLLPLVTENILTLYMFSFYIYIYIYIYMGGGGLVARSI